MSMVIFFAFLLVTEKDSGLKASIDAFLPAIASPLSNYPLPIAKARTVFLLLSVYMAFEK
jgi:hypothetical protein